MPRKRTREELAAIARRIGELLAEGVPFNDPPRRGAGEPGIAGRLSAEMDITPRAAGNLVAQIRASGLDAGWPAAEAQSREPLRRRRIHAEAARRRVYLLTAAQDETPLHEGFWANLQAYAAHRRAEILVGGFTYQKGLFEEHSVRAGIYDPRIVAHLHPVETRLAPGFLWCGQANILPTAGNPLAGWQTRGRGGWVAVPHAKIALESVPRMPGNPPVAALSTGVATMPNYVRRNAGMKAEFHHAIGFAIVEVAPDGAFWARTVSAEADGSFCDLDVRVTGGEVRPGDARVAAIVWGDIHAEAIDPAMARLSWGIDAAPDALSRLRTGRTMVDALRPEIQVFHDVLDFAARSHHNRANPVFMAARHAAAIESVEAEIARAARFIRLASRPWSRTVIVDSNHNRHFNRWLESPDGARDPANSAYWHRVNAAWHAASRAGDRRFDPFEWALREKGATFEFVRGGESFTICPESPVECGLHFDVGPNGSRGGARAFARLAERVNGGHTHSPAILEGCYVAGTNGNLWPDYVRGPQSWAHADIVTHASGKRQLVVKNDRGWRG